MRRFIVNSSLLIVHCLILLTITSYQLPIVYAADSTPSASVKSKLEELKAQIASKAAKLKSEVTSKLQNKAYVGTIKQKSASSITLATLDGSKIVSINQDSEYENLTKIKLKNSLKSLAEEDYIAALGDIDEVGVLLAKKVIILPGSLPKVKTHIWGTVISESDNLITLKTKESQNQAVSLTSKTKISGEFKDHDILIVSGFLNENKILEASFIYVKPSGAILKPKVASPSATPTATSSGKKKS